MYGFLCRKNITDQTQQPIQIGVQIANNEKYDSDNDDSSSSFDGKDVSSENEIWYNYCFSVFYNSDILNDTDV